MDELSRIFVRGGLKNGIPLSAENQILIFQVMTIYSLTVFAVA
jgi:hypothetical protein